jgi:hypothetical protein
MHDKLDKIVMGEVVLLIGEDGVLCNQCANLLNYVDRIEVELNMLTKAILDCIRNKYGIGVRMADKTNENLFPNIEEEEDKQGNCGECGWCAVMMVLNSPPPFILHLVTLVRKFHMKGRM